MLEGDEGEVIVKGEEIEVKLTELLPAIYCKAEDESDGCGAKFIITVVSSAFTGKPMLQQHRLVHKALEEERKHIHAMTLKTFTPESWEQYLAKNKANEES